MKGRKELEREIDQCLVGFQVAVTREAVADFHTLTPGKLRLRKETLAQIMAKIDRWKKGGQDE